MQTDSSQLLLKFDFVIPQSAQCCVVTNAVEIFVEIQRIIGVNISFKHFPNP